MAADQDSGTLDSAAAWSAARVAPASGSGTLARIGPVLLLAAGDDPGRLEPLVDHVRMVAANGGEGRQLVRGFALQLATTNTDPPPFVALSPHGSGLAVFVSGDASVTVDGETVDGADTLAWAERLFRWPIASISGRLGSATATPAATDSPYDLRAGVIPAGGFSVLAGAGPVPAGEPVSLGKAAPAPALDEPPAPAPVPAPAPAPVEAPAPAEVAAEVAEPADLPLAPPGDRPVPGAVQPEVPRFESVLLDGPDAQADLDLGPLPIAGDHVHAELDPRVSLVNGVFCKNQHFNDPRVLFCGQCGINMVQQTPVLVQGGRPPLGVVVLDDGSVYQLDGNYLLGRDPDSDPRVRTGEFRSVPTQDQSQLISRVHARLELREWDVVLIDNNSTNGTFFLEPGDAHWRQLPPGGEQRLVPRTRIRIGNRSLAYDTTHQG